MDWLEATIRNSNLLPVNAKGLVLFRSVMSIGSLGRVVTPISIFSPERPGTGLPAAMASTISVS
jgi:hypothetical protein